MKTVNAGIVPDNANDTESLTFYSISDSIDPETGFDSRSNKTLPSFVTQISSFSLRPILFNKGVWRRKGLNVNDYIVRSKVTTKSYSKLMEEISGNVTNHNMGVDGKPPAPLIVMIDTEGYDCHIVNGISSESDYLPFYIIFESKQCSPSGLTEAKEHLEHMGYTVLDERQENTIAARSNFVQI